MKRLTALLSALLLCSLCACGDTAAARSLPPAASADASTGTEDWAEPQAENITYTVDRKSYSNTAGADDGTELVSYQFDLPVLRAYRGDGTEITEAKDEAEQTALDVTVSFAEKFESWSEGDDFQTTAKDANEDYEWRRADGIEWMPYCDELTFTSWQTEHLVSIGATYYSDRGGAHPNTTQLSWLFDLDSGTFVEPTIIAADEQEFRDAVTAEIVRQANLTNEDGTTLASEYWEDYESVAAEWCNYAVSFDSDGMTVCFSTYELACYAAGAQIFTMSWDFLTPYLSDSGRTLLGIPQAG